MCFYVNIITNWHTGIKYISPGVVWTIGTLVIVLGVKVGSFVFLGGFRENRSYFIKTFLGSNFPILFTPNCLPTSPSRILIHNLWFLINQLDYLVKGWVAQTFQLNKKKSSKIFKYMSMQKVALRLIKEWSIWLFQYKCIGQTAPFQTSQLRWFAPFKVTEAKAIQKK